MNRTRIAALCAAVSFVVLGAATLAPPAFAEKTVEVGGAPMYPSKNIVQNAVNSKDHTTLVAAVKAAGLVDTLMSPGPFTVFAPVNKAFEKLPKGTVETLLKPENKTTLTAVLPHPGGGGQAAAGHLQAQGEAGGRQGAAADLPGGEAHGNQGGPSAQDLRRQGGKSSITIPDVNQSNGVIHV